MHNKDVCSPSSKSGFGIGINTVDLMQANSDTSASQNNKISGFSLRPYSDAGTNFDDLSVISDHVNRQKECSKEVEALQEKEQLGAVSNAALQKLPLTLTDENLNSTGGGGENGGGRGNRGYSEMDSTMPVATEGIVTAKNNTGGGNGGGRGNGRDSGRTWDPREIEVINKHAESEPTRKTISKIEAELEPLDLPHKHTRRAIQDKFNKAREDFLKKELEAENKSLKEGKDDENNELKAEIQLLKEEMAILKTAKEKAEQDLVVERHKSAMYAGRDGIERLIKAEVAQEKFESASIVTARYQKLEESLLAITAKYFHQ